MLRKVPATVGSLRSSPALSLHSRLRIQPSRSTSTKSADPKDATSENIVSNKDSPESGAEALSKKKKTQAELDDELRQKLEAMSGDGGAAGLELEDGQPVSMKRSVKNNMFRYI
ncbi:hypothetical protein HO133_007394 [Letharia lupina]|uniref:Uncharacterized protein n=1 Tax=Letharia lupina TaxID=560253 RepID=A0A8H6FIU0_9LECA|nr:uncharacterized protein HO133_007394 [Letharia lupina]KAF6229278.1 hypothetical protein HO133_007394 [Letharia lupina]